MTVCTLEISQTEPKPNFKTEILHYEGGEALAQVAQRRCGCPLPGSVQGQVGCGFEQPGVAEDVPAHGRGVGTRSQNRRLEKTSKTIKSNHPPNNTMPTKPYPEVPHLHVF